MNDSEINYLENEENVNVERNENINGMDIINIQISTEEINEIRDISNRKTNELHSKLH